MVFSSDQITELSAPLSRDVVKTREQGGRSVSYVEGWHVIAESNRIFGFDAWSSTTVEIKCVSEKERDIGQQRVPGWGVTYIARVRIQVDTVVRDGVGAGHGIDRDLGQAHESAIKEAETDARKRALMTFGNRFGLALYDKTQANVVDEGNLTQQRYIDACNAKIDTFDPAKDDPKSILVWWNNEHKARDDLLNPAQRIEMKNRLTARLPARTGASQASQT
jgi:DNA repair and recombination protein RAD52